MKSPFPAAPNWRYERMALGAVVSAVLIAMGLTFGSAALQVAAYVPTPWSFPPDVAALRLWAIGISAGALLSLGIAFLLFSAYKLRPNEWERYMCWRVRLRQIGLMWVWFAAVWAGLWVVVNIALHVTR